MVSAAYAHAVKDIGINFEPKSTLAFILAVSLVAVFISSAAKLDDLAHAAWPILVISGLVWLIFIGLSLARNFGMR